MPAWTDGSAAGDASTPTWSVDDKPPFWADLDNAEQALWGSTEFALMTEGLSGHVDPTSDIFAEQITTHLLTGLRNARLVAACSRMLQAQAKATMGDGGGIRGLINALTGTTDYDRVEVGGLMFSSAVLLDQEDHIWALCRLIKIWIKGQLGATIENDIIDRCIPQSKLFGDDEGDADLEDRL